MATVTNNAAYEIPNFVIGVLEANIDMSVEATFQFVGVACKPATGTGLLGPASVDLPAAGGVIIGILQNNPALAESAVVMQSGISKALFSATVATIGTILKVDTNGNFLAATSGTQGVAMSLQVGASGAVSSVLVANFGAQ